MKRSEYKAITKGIGARLRQLYKGAASRYPAPRSLVLEQLEEAGITGDLRRRVLDEAADLATKARAGATPLRLGQLADERAVALVRELRRADSLVGDDEDAMLPGEQTEGELAALDKVAAQVASGLSAEDFEKQQAAERERARLRELGVKVG
jgi:hypothetical protein